MSSIVSISKRLAARFGASALAWSWITVLAATLVCGALAWIQHRQRQFDTRFSRELGHLRGARIDLAKGYVHVVLAGAPQAPYDRAQGLALLDQAVLAFDQALRERRLAAAAEPLPTLAEFAGAMRRFRGRLAGLRAAPAGDPLAEAELRRAFDALERQADAMDSLIRGELAIRSRRHDAAFAGILGGAILLFAGISGAVYANGRAREAAERARRAHEAEVERLSRLYAALSQVNQAVIRTAGKAELLPKVCQAMVEFGGFPLAWIGEFDAAAGVVNPVASHGEGGAALPPFPFDFPAESGMGAADPIREGHGLVLCLDLLGEARLAPLHEHALCHGFRALAAMPIRPRGHAPLLLGVEVHEAMVLRDREKALLAETAADVAFALEKLDDLAERRRAEAAVRQANAELESRVAARTAQLEAANKELEAFSYSVSHDLRAPLRAIDGFVQILEEDFAPQLSGEARRCLGVVQGNARKMGRLIEDLLKFSRLGRQPLVKREVDVNELVRAALEDLRLEQEGRSLDLRLGGLPPCQGDPALLKQVWLNLLGNAFKYTRRRERALVEVGGRREAGEVEYWVKDNGAGFDMAYAGKLFGVFQRLHGESEFEGTGIGLAIVKRIVLRHGGRVWAEGQPEVGATFHFALEGSS
ncbi:MAG: ATP-binding protein [Lentisphaeria bacterium]|jgi:signal transduction histidine kinase